MAASEADTQLPAQGDVLGTFGESVIEPPVAKVRRVSLFMFQKEHLDLLHLSIKQEDTNLDVQRLHG
eukprot:345325-Amphidinium_carterae.1